MKWVLLFLFLCLSGFISAQGNLWEEKDQEVNGFARVFHQGRFSFINSRKELIAPFRFEDARPFSNQLAAVKQEGRWGFINGQGVLAIPCDYEIVFDFTEKLTPAYRLDHWWLLNTKGERVRLLDISVCYGFHNGMARVEKNGRKGILYADGRMVFDQAPPPAFARIVPLPTNTTSSVCPPNLDFEFGNFTNWNCYIGNVDTVGNLNVINVNPSPPTPNRHTIITRATPSALDPFGLFPTNPPDGSQYCVRLGNSNVNAQAERIRYVIHVPQNDSNFSFQYYYAVVMQDPGHTPWSQPRFQAFLFDSTDNVYITCASFEYVATSNLPGFMHSTVNPIVIYKPWAPVFISLQGYAGKTVFLDFTTADCARGAHFGYAYVDVTNTCGQSIQYQYSCDTPHVTTLTGPPGFQFYNWWNQNYTTLLGTGQTVTLNPGPPPNSTVWLTMIPFANYGCNDTIPVTLTGTIAASFGASDTLGVCAPHAFTFYNHNLPSIATTWNFGDGTSGTGDTVTHVYTLPGTYVVTLSVSQQAGCTGFATDTVRVVEPTGSFSYTGGSYCNSQTVQFTATTSYTDSLHWDFGDGSFLTTTQATVSHTYANPGVYVPHLVLLSVNGCQLSLPGPDTIRIERLVPGFSQNIQNFCAYTLASFTDTSYSYFGLATHNWNFGDGNTGTGVSVSHTYALPGTYNVKLVITGVTGCTDSLVKSIVIIVHNNPASSIAGPLTGCPGSTLAFNGTVVSADAVGSMSWSCTNGATGTGSTFTVSFGVAGTYSVSLISTTVFGCSDTAYRTVVISPLPTATIAGAGAVCLNGTPPVITFTGVGGTAPYIFTYQINGGSNLTVTATSGNTATVTAPTNVAGIFTYNLVSVREGSANACLQAQTGSAAVVVKPLPTATLSGASPVCMNAASPMVTFRGANGTAPYTFTYSVNGGPNLTVTTTSGDSVTVAVPTNAAGTITYTLLAVQEGSPNACSQSQSATVTVTVNPLPTASLSAPASACINGLPPLVTFTGAGATPPYTFVYRVNNGATHTITTTGGNSVSLPASTNVAGTFNYTLVSVTEGSSLACTQAQNGSTVITVNPLPNVAAGIDRELCLGSSLQLNATGAAQYAWSPATGLSCTSCPNPVANPTDTIGYIVQGTSSFGCVASDTMSVNVIKPFPMTASPDDTLCVGGSLMLHASGAASYLWSPTTGLSRTDVSVPTASPLSTITYRVVGYDGHNCFSDTAYIKITVGQLPQVNAGGDLHLATGDVVMLNPQVQNGPVIQWLWQPATGLSCSDCPAPRMTVGNNLTYIVTVTNDYHCVGTDRINIFTFCKSSQVFIPNAFTPDGDGLNDVLMVRGKGIHVKFFRVFSRWGELVFERTDFEPNDPKYGWDGRIRGVPATPDVFVYTAEVVCDNNVLYTLKGNTMLLK